MSNVDQGSDPSQQAQPSKGQAHLGKIVKAVRDALKKGDTSTVNSRLDELERAVGGPFSAAASESSPAPSDGQPAA